VATTDDLVLVHQNGTDGYAAFRQALAGFLDCGLHE
jgi:hypothetical protein